MHAWAGHAVDALEAGQPCALISLLAVEGSTPREAGTRMAVSGSGCAGSIGGGHLEFEAVRQARAVLERAPGTWRIQDYPLGPLLGQCCGGRVRLMVEHLDFAQKDWLAEAKTRPAFGLETRLFDDHVERHMLAAAVPPVLAARGAQPGPGDELIEAVGEPLTSLHMFGAGHVGIAIARVLNGLPFDLSWCDTRPECAGPAGLVIADEAAALQQAREARGPVLVLTHDHALDYRLVTAALRGEASFIGVIGSATKKARFFNRLRKDGFSDDSLTRLHCPIGIVGISGKAPEIIAVSVVAQLLKLRG